MLALQKNIGKTSFPGVKPEHENNKLNCRDLSLWYIIYYRSPVRNSLAQLIGTVAHHCDDINEWPQLLAFLERFVKSDNAIERQVRHSALTNWLS